MKKKIKIILVIVTFLFYICSINTYAFNRVIDVEKIKKSKEFEQWEKLAEEERKEVIEPSYSSIKLEDSMKKSKYNFLLKNLGTSTLEKKFDLRDKLQNIYVKNQRGAGSCWAFSYTSVLESTISNKYNKKSDELSPMHLDYLAAKMYNRKVGDSGTMLMEMAYSAGRYGPVLEMDLPFSSVYDEEKNSRYNYYLSNIDEVSTDQEVVAKVEDMPILANINKEYTENGIKYITSDGEISSNQVKAIRESIKKHIKENGAVTAQFYSDMGIVANNNKEDFISVENFYNNETNAYYCNDSEKNANHAVTIVGWDDEFEIEKFSEGKRPENKGAYIVLNSWGADFGDEGYFYVSYDDVIIENYIMGVSSIQECDKNKKDIELIYQYDNLGVNVTLPLNISSVFAANVFNKTNTNQIEYINEVGITLMSTEGIEVYVSQDISEDGKIKAIGNPVASYTGANALEPGYHTIKLTSPIKVTEDKFAIIIKYINQTFVDLPIECNLKDSKLTTVDNLYDTATSNVGESFISIDNAESWNDIYNLKVSDTVTLKNTNVCIKAFTLLENQNEKEPDEQETIVNVTGLNLNKNSEVMEVGDKLNLIATIEPINATNKNIIWSSNNSDVVIVSKEGIITAVGEGEAIISAMTEDGNYTSNCKIKVVKKINTDDDIYKEDDKEEIKQNNTEIQVQNNKDETVANKILPNTGTKYIVVLIVLIAGIGVIFLKKYKGYNDVK